MSRMTFSLSPSFSLSLSLSLSRARAPPLHPPSFLKRSILLILFSPVVLHTPSSSLSSFSSLILGQPPFSAPSFRFLLSALPTFFHLPRRLLAAVAARENHLAYCNMIAFSRIIIFVQCPFWIFLSWTFNFSFRYGRVYSEVPCAKRIFLLKDLKF